VTLVDTGAETQTGGRLRRITRYVADETFMMTYGDGVADVDLRALLAFHERRGTLATVTAVQPPGRFGALDLADGEDLVRSFVEKPGGDGAWMNGGFFVLESAVLDYIDGDATLFERGPLERLAADGQLSAYRHRGYWQPMDTLRDKRILEDLWDSGHAPWKTW
jgi:glucose-1-phosphate cytidylyltransferase